MSRTEFVAASYANYDRRERNLLVSQRVQGWRNDPPTVDFLREAAGRGGAPARPAARVPAVNAGSFAGHAS
jgi:hypothetical protein